MTSLLVHPQATPLRGRVPVPADRGIAHRALVVAALCNGFSTLKNYGFDDDTERTRACLEALGVEIQVSREERSLRVRGVGLYGLVPPKGPLLCGASRPTLMLLSGILAPQDFESELHAEGTLARTPLQDLAAPLRERGAQVSARGRGLTRGDAVAPLLIGALPEESYLKAIEWQSPRADADLKGALLLSGLFAHGETLLREGVLSADHLERLFFALDLPIRASGPLVMLDPAGWSGSIAAFDATIPGDQTAAAALVAAATLVPESNVEVRAVAANVARGGFAEALREMGAPCTSMVRGEELGEVVSDLRAGCAELRPLSLGGERAFRATEELGLLAALAAFADGPSQFKDFAVPGDPDKLAALTALLRAFGREAGTEAACMTVHGKRDQSKAARVSSGGDPAMVLTAVLLALRADGPSRVDDVDCVRRVFPRFVGTMRALGARIDVLTD